MRGYEIELFGFYNGEPEVEITVAISAVIEHVDLYYSEDTLFES
jgi:hypothetical protein